MSTGERTETTNNLSLQNDEVEALSAIYDDEWCVVDDGHRIYCIQVTDGQPRPVWSVCIQVHMPVNYPSEAPPQYQLNAPWLRGDERRNLEAMLADVYCENTGESIVYLWVEKIREFILDKSSHIPAGSESQGKRLITMTTETDDGDVDFDMVSIETDSVGSDISDHSDVGEDCECPSITHGETITDRRSTFQPHLAHIVHKKQIRLVLARLYENKKIANATHNIMAYRLVSGHSDTPIVCQGCDDDGETHAGSRMSHLLKILDVENVMVVVSRWYGGIHLGPDRFKHINNCTRAILDMCGYIKEKDDKKGPRSSDKKKR